MKVSERGKELFAFWRGCQLKEGGREKTFLKAEKGGYPRFFEKIGGETYFHELFRTPSDSFSLCMCISIYNFLIKPSHFTETKIYVKLDPKTRNTACSYHLKSDTFYSKWN